MSLEDQYDAWVRGMMGGGMPTGGGMPGGGGGMPGGMGGR